jgi:hypothetical protein
VKRKPGHGIYALIALVLIALVGARVVTYSSRHHPVSAHRAVKVIKAMAAKNFKGQRDESSLLRNSMVSSASAIAFVAVETPHHQFPIGSFESPDPRTLNRPPSS